MESEERKVEDTHPDEPRGNGETTSEPYETAQHDDKRKVEETHPDEPRGNGETTSEPYEPAQRDDKPRPAESKPADESEEQAQRATDDGMSKRTEGRA